MPHNQVYSRFHAHWLFCIWSAMLWTTSDLLSLAKAHFNSITLFRRFISCHLFTQLLVCFLYFLDLTSMLGTSDEALLPSCPLHLFFLLGLPLRKWNQALPPSLPGLSLIYLPMHLLADLCHYWSDNSGRFLLIEGSNNQWVRIYLYLHWLRLQQLPVSVLWPDHWSQGRVEIRSKDFWNAVSYAYVIFMMFICSGWF